MALKPSRTKQFKKDYKRIDKRGWDIAHLDEVMTKLIKQEKLPKEYGAHGLSADWKGYRECHVEGNFLLIWRETGSEITFVRVGNHADLFGK
jgi:mRNA interferase YafQ